jgi:16S rRNA (guanine1207-N2)-methyltransferase
MMVRVTQPFSFDTLRRRPDVEAPNLFAVDASDRLILDEAAEALAVAEPGTVVVVGDRYGALTLGAAANSGARGIRVYQDPLTGEIALAKNAERYGLRDSFTSTTQDAALFTGATVVLLQMPRTIAELEETASLIAANADPDVVVFAGARLKHLTASMSEALSKQFADVVGSLARQKSRVIVARTPRPRATGPFPAREFSEALGLWIVAHGGAFAGTRLDIGTRFLLAYLPDMKPDAVDAIDLGCGTGILAAAIAAARPELRVIATDQSAAAVASAVGTVEANGLSERVSVVRDDLLTVQPDASCDLILCNPPFHVGAAVHADVAYGRFEEASRVLRPGGELWTVFNSALSHASVLRKMVGKTEVIGQNGKFTVTRSIKR